MSGRSPAGGPSHAGRGPGPLAIPAFPADEWELLVRLPARVIAAAAAVEPRRAAPTVEERLAGLAAIAAGRVFDSDLVRAVVAAIYRESDEEPLPVPREGRSALFAACREADRLLGRRADPADSAAYRQWLQSIAARGFGAARVGPPGVGGPAQLSAAQRQFLAELGAALGLA